MRDGKGMFSILDKTRASDGRTDRHRTVAYTALALRRGVKEIVLAYSNVKRSNEY